MASEKDNVFGVIVGLAVLGAFIQTDEHAPPAPKICYVPQQDGTTIPLEIKALPCDQMVAEGHGRCEKCL